MKYFSDEFGLTPAEIVALMGVHTLGEAEIENAGFKVGNTVV